MHTAQIHLAKENGINLRCVVGMREENKQISQKSNINAHNFWSDKCFISFYANSLKPYNCVNYLLVVFWKRKIKQTFSIIFISKVKPHRFENIENSETRMKFERIKRI